MAVAREKVLASRMRKKLAASKSAQEKEVEDEEEDEEKDEVAIGDLVEPIQQVVLQEKVKVPIKSSSRKKKSVLVPGGGMSMGMEVD